MRKNAGAMVVQFFVVWRFFPETKQVLLEETDVAMRTSG